MNRNQHVKRDAKPRVIHCQVCDKEVELEPGKVGRPTRYCQDHDYSDLRRTGNPVGRPKGGRLTKGGKHLTEEDQAAIRNAYLSGGTTLHRVADAFGVSYQTVWRLAK